jgi:hypothetical protein
MAWSIATASGTTTITPDGTSSADLDTLLDTAIAASQTGISKPAPGVYRITNNLKIAGNTNSPYYLFFSSCTISMDGSRFVRGGNTRVKCANQRSNGSVGQRPGLIFNKSPGDVYEWYGGLFSADGGPALLEVSALDVSFIYAGDGALMYGYDIDAFASGVISGATFSGNNSGGNAVLYLGGHSYSDCKFSGLSACELTDTAQLTGIVFSSVGVVKINAADGYLERCSLTNFRTQAGKIGYLTDCTYSVLSQASAGGNINLRNSLEILGSTNEASAFLVVRTAGNTQIYKRTLSSTGAVSGGNPKGDNNSTTTSADRLILLAATYNPVSAVFAVDYRGTWESVVVKYGRLPSAFSHAIDGLLTGKQSIPFGSLPDTDITVSNTATVAGYTEFAFTHTSSTIAVSSATTVQKLHDYCALEKASFVDSGITTGGNPVPKCCLPTLGDLFFTRSTGDLLYSLSLAANITGGPIVLASGKNVTITAAGNYQTSVITVRNGGTVTVPSGATNLIGWTLTGATINVSTGNATVTVSSTVGVTAGPGVTLQLDPKTLTLTGFPANSQIVVSRSGIQQAAVNNPNPAIPYVFTSDSGSPFYDVVIKSAGYKDYVEQFDLTNSVSVPVSMDLATSTQSISEPLVQFQVLMGKDAAFIRTITEAEAVPALADEVALVKTWVWPSAGFKTDWNAILDHASVADPSNAEVTIWAGYLTTVGYAGISFTVTGRIS